VFGQVPSNATVSRFFERTVVNPELFSYGIETLTRELRSRAWSAAGPRNPALSPTAADPLIIDLDATLVTSHSDKEHVAGNYKGGYGFAPLCRQRRLRHRQGLRGNPRRPAAPRQRRREQRR
jgi:hypothetical protein